MKKHQKKLFISLPMTGRNEDDVLAEMFMWKEKIERVYGEKMTLMDNYHKKANMTKAEMIADSIMIMTQSDIIFFVPKWYQTRGCRIERMIAQEYMPENIVDKKRNLLITGADLNIIKDDIRYGF